MLLKKRQNELECDRCGEVVEGWMNIRRYGQWDREAQNFQRHGGISERFCRECWDENEGRSPGAHIWPDSAQELWDILAASNGKLAATLIWWSGRPAIRVVGGEPEAVVTKRKHGGETADGTPILEFEAELVDDFDREKFDDYAEPPEEMNLVVLTAPDRTAFAAIDGGESDGE